MVGVVKDFYYRNFWRKIGPAILSLVPDEQYRYLIARIDSEDLQAVSQYFQTQWQKVFPNLPYAGFFQDDAQAEAIQVTQSISTIFFYISVISILIASMGLFAMVSLNIAKRTKEIGIRKILGASVVRIGQLISKEFVLLLIFASFLASWIGYFSVDILLKSIYAYYVDFGFSPFFAAAVLMFLIAILTVGSQVYKVATRNPIEALRYE